MLLFPNKQVNGGYAGDEGDEGMPVQGYAGVRGYAGSGHLNKLVTS